MKVLEYGLQECVKFIAKMFALSFKFVEFMGILEKVTSSKEEAIMLQQRCKNLKGNAEKDIHEAKVKETLLMDEVANLRAVMKILKQ